MPRGKRAAGTTDGSTAGGTATLERDMSAATGAAGRQIKPLLGLTVDNYDFAVVNGTYQAVMQQGRGWIPVATIPAFIVADWLVQKGVLPPLGNFLTNGTTPSQSRSSGTQSKIATGNRV